MWMGRHEQLHSNTVPCYLRDLSIQGFCYPNESQNLFFIESRDNYTDQYSIWVISPSGAHQPFPCYHHPSLLLEPPSSLPCKYFRIYTDLECNLERKMEPGQYLCRKGQSSSSATGTVIELWEQTIVDTSMGWWWCCSHTVGVGDVGGGGRW